MYAPNYTGMGHILIVFGEIAVVDCIKKADEFIDKKPNSRNTVIDWNVTTTCRTDFMKLQISKTSLWPMWIPSG
jgi:hypothetical protein